MAQPSPSPRRRAAPPVSAALTVALLLTACSSDRKAPSGLMRCDDPASDHNVVPPTGMSNDEALSETMSFGDLASAAVAADGKRLVVTVRMSEALPVPVASSSPKRAVGVVLLYGDNSRDKYTVSFEWDDRKVELSSGGGQGDPVNRFRIDDGSAEAEIPLSDVPLLQDKFQWRATSVASQLILFDNVEVPIVAQDSCPGEARAPSYLRFVSGPIPSDESSPAASDDDDDAYRPPGSVEEERSTAPTNKLVGIVGSGGGDLEMIDPGPDCTDGASGCGYDNGIDFSVLRGSIADSVEPVLGVRPEVDCDRPNTTPPNRVRAGATFTCVFDVPPGQVGVVEVKVRPRAGWAWRVVDVTGD